MQRHEPIPAGAVAHGLERIDDARRLARRLLGSEIADATDERDAAPKVDRGCDPRVGMGDRGHWQEASGERRAKLADAAERQGREQPCRHADDGDRQGLGQSREQPGLGILGGAGEEEVVERDAEHQLASAR